MKPVAADGKLKVFILSGQSNMEGKAAIGTLDAVINYPDTHDQFKHLKPDGKWLVRDDVYVTYLCRQGLPEGGSNYGPLTVGFGSFKRNKADRNKPFRCIGPELGIGMLLGDYYEDPVLLIKAAWGGKSVKHNFLPPSAMPSDEEIRAKHEEIMQRYAAAKKRFEGAQKRYEAAKAEGKKAGRRPKEPRVPPDYETYKASFGAYYGKILEEYEKVIGDIKTYVPGYDVAKGYDLAGFVWFQGWNDGCSGSPRYTELMAHFIKDTRKALNTPDLPFVIGELGVDGLEPIKWVATFRKQQAAIAALPEFKGAVRFARTAHCQYRSPYDMTEKWKEFQRLAKINAAKPKDDPTYVRRFFDDQWVKKYARELAFTSDKRYHYGGSGRTYYEMGLSMGNAMVELLKSAE
jgi:alpha-galactosidase